REVLALPIDDPSNIGGPGVNCRLSFSPDGTRLALVGLNGVTVWEATPGPEVLTLNAPVDVWGIAYSSNGRQLVTADKHDAVSIRDAATGRMLLTLPIPEPAHGMSVVDAQISLVSARIAACVATGSTGRVVLWDATTGRVIGQLKGHASHVINVA